jgi:hypothetical protein
MIDMFADCLLWLKNEDDQTLINDITELLNIEENDIDEIIKEIMESMT